MPEEDTTPPEETDSALQRLLQRLLNSDWKSQLREDKPAFAEFNRYQQAMLAEQLAEELKGDL